MSNYYGTGVYGTAVYTNPSPPTLPSNTVAPAISDQALVGLIITCSTGTWTDSGHISYAYQWQDSSDGATGWGNITGATSSSYTIPSTEQFKFLRCVVTDTDANGSTSANSNSVQVSWPVPLNTAAPIASGTAQVDSILTSTAGTWTDDGSPTFTYQWQTSSDGASNWTNISTGAIYMIEAARLGQYLRCQATNTDSGGSATANSNVLGPVTAVPSTGLQLLPITPGSLTLNPDPNSP